MKEDNYNSDNSIIIINIMQEAEKEHTIKKGNRKGWEKVQLKKKDKKENKIMKKKRM